MDDDRFIKSPSALAEECEVEDLTQTTVSRFDFGIVTPRPES